MMSLIHDSAIIEEGAILGTNVSIGPFVYIGSKVKIGDNTTIASHAVIEGNTTIGKNNRIFSHTAVGTIPQDLKFKGEDVQLIIGDNNTIREFTLLNPGTKGGGSVTKIGNGNLLMGYVHLGHDVIIGDNCILANGATLALCRCRRTHSHTSVCTHWGLCHDRRSLCFGTGHSSFLFS